MKYKCNFLDPNSFEGKITAFFRMVWHDVVWLIQKNMELHYGSSSVFLSVGCWLAAYLPPNNVKQDKKYLLCQVNRDYGENKWWCDNCFKNLRISYTFKLVISIVYLHWGSFIKKTTTGFAWYFLLEAQLHNTSFIKF